PEALQLAEQAFARDPQDALVCAELAKELAAAGGAENNRRAVEIAQRATALNPRETDFWQQLGTCLQSVNREADAADAFLRALDRAPPPLPPRNAGMAPAAPQRPAAPPRLYASLVADLQSRHRASDLLWRAVYRQPEDPTAHERLARFLLD